MTHEEAIRWSEEQERLYWEERERIEAAAQYEIERILEREMIEYGEECEEPFDHRLES